MTIYILSYYPIPSGLAATNRILTYAKALEWTDVRVKILIPVPMHSPSSVKIPRTGFVGEVEYEYLQSPNGIKIRLIHRIFSILKLYDLIGFVNSYKYYLRFLDKNEKNVQVITSDKLIRLMILGIIGKRYNLKNVFIFDEFPSPIRTKLKNDIPWIKRKLYSFVLRNYQGYISISNDLKNFYTKLNKKLCFILSNIIDVDLFNIVPVYNNKVEILTYTGNMELKKDNIDLIINAFAIVNKKYPQLKLMVYGPDNSDDGFFLKDLVYNLNLSSKVIFGGVLSRKQIPQILGQSDILVTSQPKTKRASGGFPTKLAEYLISGKPTILTRVGDNELYVKDKVHAFFVEPHDIQGYADAICNIIENYNTSKDVAINGKLLIYNKYSHKIQGVKLRNFLTDL